MTDKLHADSQGPVAADGVTETMRHTSIIYFHGMGTPKRYEELSRVLDTLDRYAGAQPDERLGILRGQRVSIEPARTGDEEPVAFIQFSRFIRRRSGKTRRIGAYCLYESYWSPAAAGAVSALNVGLWVLLRTLNPLTVLARPWRAHQRLKLTYLSRLFFDRGAVPALRYRQLAKLYREFEGMSARRRFPRGVFSDFRKAVQESAGSDKVAMQDLVRLAHHWRRSLASSQLSAMSLAATVLAAALGWATLTLHLAVLALSAVLGDVPWLVPLARRSALAPVWLTIGAIAIAPVAILLVAAFLRNFLSDVVFWTTTFEKDVRYLKRREILRACEQTVRHVLKDPLCERIVVVGHSLGTAIAYETLLNLGRKAKAGTSIGDEELSRLLRKVSHIITFGSPIDRISYFFSLTYSRYHHFNRVADTLLGNTSDAPFQADGKRAIQWLNVRDPADPISSRLFSPRGPLPNRDDIQEVAVTSSHIPNPAASHAGYFESNLGAKLLFDACVLNRRQVQAQEERSYISRGIATLGRRTAWAAGAVIAWCLGFGAAGYWLEEPLWAEWARMGTVGGSAVLVAVVLIGWCADRFERLRLPT